MPKTILSRPHCHFTPPHGWMNDPNGLIFHQNIWHLFYQFQPLPETTKRWGHAKSSDLIHWEFLPDALLPDENGEIWSGSAVHDNQNTSGFFDGAKEGGLVAIFTSRNGQAKTQSQSLAYSHDAGQTWAKYERNPVLRHNRPDFRDPKVFWHAPTSAWVMIAAAGHETEIYRSPDLKTWEFASRWGENLMPGLVWECPDLFSVPDKNGDERGEKWILLSSFLDMNNFKKTVAPCFAAYFAGSFDGFTFKADALWNAPTRFDFGPDNYAPVSFANASPPRRLVLGWLNHWGYAPHLDTRPWQGQMTLPRELFWRNGLCQQIAPECYPAFAAQTALNQIGDAVRVDTRHNPAAIFLPDGGGSWKIEARQNGDLVWALERDEKQTRWRFERGPASIPPFKPGETAQDLAAFWTKPHAAPINAESEDGGSGGKKGVRVFVDTYSVEAFCEAQTVFSAQIFPASNAPLSITQISSD